MGLARSAKMYDIMHRSQLNLEQWQYEALVVRGEREGRSLSDLVREAVTEYLTSEPKPKRPLSSLRGLGEGAESSGRRHDELLYGGR